MLTAIILARGGSKGLPGKNIKLLAGKPLIAWSIECAKESKIFDKILLSTDSEEIAEIAEKSGATVPGLRPNHLAQDNAKSIDVLKYLFEKDSSIKDFVLLQPTSPLRTASDILGAVELYKSKTAGSILTVCECEHSPLYSNVLPEDLSLANFLQHSLSNTNRQELKQYYRLNGSIYISTPEFVLKNNDFFGIGSYAYVMPKERSVDIDDLFDFRIAEYILKERTAK